MKTILSLTLFVVTFGAAAEEPKNAEVRKKAIDKALEDFAGTWEITAVRPEGVTQGARALVFRTDMTYAALDPDGKVLWSGTFELDPTTTPKVWDHRSDEAKKKGGDALGIYELNGDKLRLCCVVGTWKDKQWTGKSRPMHFMLPAADAVLDLRRVKRDE